MFETVKNFWLATALVSMYSAAVFCVGTMDDINTETKE